MRRFHHFTWILLSVGWIRSSFQTAQPTLIPTMTMIPSGAPTPLPSSVPIPSPTSMPTPTPTPLPSSLPSNSPSAVPTQFSPYPTIKPTHPPTTIPSPLPSNSPTIPPSPVPSMVPTPHPSQIPTIRPSPLPSPLPSMVPTLYPSSTPTPVPSLLPTLSPTPLPTLLPSQIPTPVPSLLPTLPPTPLPSSVPSPPPSQQPSPLPTAKPTVIPTPAPSRLPTPIPTKPPYQAFNWELLLIGCGSMVAVIGCGFLVGRRLLEDHRAKRAVDAAAKNAAKEKQKLEDEAAEAEGGQNSKSHQAALRDKAVRESPFNDVDSLWSSREERTRVPKKKVTAKDIRRNQARKARKANKIFLASIGVPGIDPDVDSEDESEAKIKGAGSESDEEERAPTLIMHRGAVPDTAMIRKKERRLARYLDAFLSHARKDVDLLQYADRMRLLGHGTIESLLIELHGFDNAEFKRRVGCKNDYEISAFRELLANADWATGRVLRPENALSREARGASDVFSSLSRGTSIPLQALGVSARTARRGTSVGRSSAAFGSVVARDGSASRARGGGGRGSRSRSVRNRDGDNGSLRDDASQRRVPRSSHARAETESVSRGASMRAQHRRRSGDAGGTEQSIGAHLGAGLQVLGLTAAAPKPQYSADELKEIRRSHPVRLERQNSGVSKLRREREASERARQKAAEAERLARRKTSPSEVYRVCAIDGTEQLNVLPGDNGWAAQTSLARDSLRIKARLDSDRPNENGAPSTLPRLAYSTGEDMMERGLSLLRLGNTEPLDNNVPRSSLSRSRMELRSSSSGVAGSTRTRRTTKGSATVRERSQQLIRNTGVMPGFKDEIERRKASLERPSSMFMDFNFDAGLTGRALGTAI